MIVRYERDVTLMDCEALAVQLGRPVSTIRARCESIASDCVTRRLLFDAERAAETLAGIKSRVSRPRRLTKSTL